MIAFGAGIFSLVLALSIPQAFTFNNESNESSCWMDCMPKPDHDSSTAYFCGQISLFATCNNGTWNQAKQCVKTCPDSPDKELGIYITERMQQFCDTPIFQKSLKSYKSHIPCAESACMNVDNNCSDTCNAHNLYKFLEYVISPDTTVIQNSTFGKICGSITCYINQGTPILKQQCQQAGSEDALGFLGNYVDELLEKNGLQQDWPIECLPFWSNTTTTATITTTTTTQHHTTTTHHPTTAGMKVGMSVITVLGGLALSYFFSFN